MSLASYSLTKISYSDRLLLQELLRFDAASLDLHDLVDAAKKLTQYFCEQMQILRADGKGRKVFTLNRPDRGVKILGDALISLQSTEPSSTKGPTNSQLRQRRNVQGAKTSTSVPSKS